ncbi:MAG: hypothetical protein ACI4VP_00915 [Clostridia bacterium]
MKKVIVGIILVIILSLAVNNVVFAENTTATLEEENANEIFEMKDEVKTKLDEYTEKYGSEAYGLAAYILNIARIYSIPVCFIGIIVGALNQYVLGTRRLDKKHKGYGIIMTFVTLLVVCQVLPLIFTIVVMGWRG